MHIAADHLFSEDVGAGSVSTTVAEMVYHIGMADKAFRATDFNQDGGPGDGIGFVIAAVTVFKEGMVEKKLCKTVVKRITKSVLQTGQTGRRVSSPNKSTPRKSRSRGFPLALEST